MISTYDQPRKGQEHHLKSSSETAVPSSLWYYSAIVTVPVVGST